MELKCGYLDFRNPAKESWYTIRVWPRKWVEARINRGSDGQSVLLEAYEDQNEFDKTVICVLLEKVTAIRRTSIRNRFAFEIYSGERPILFLGADSEYICHEWISVLKRALFPTMAPVKKLPDVGTEFYHVWALPGESANKIRLIGEFLLAVTEDHFTLYNETGTLCLRWQMNYIKRFVILNNKDIAPVDCGKILHIQTGRHSPDGPGQYFFYSIQAEEILQQIMTKIGQAMEKINAEQDKKAHEDNIKSEEGKQQSKSENSPGVLPTSGNPEIVPSIAMATSTDSAQKSAFASVHDQQKTQIDALTNGRISPEGKAQTDDGEHDMTSPPGNNQVDNCEPISVSESSQTGTWPFAGPHRLRGNSTGSSGYSSDPLEISGLSTKYPSGLSEDNMSFMNTSSVLFEREDSYLKSISFASDSSFSFSSGHDRVTKPRRNTYSGGQGENANNQEKTITNQSRQIVRRCTLSSINELYKYQRESLTDDPVYSRESYGESDIVFENELNENDDDTSCAIGEESARKDIPAPFELIDIYLVSARAKLMKDSQNQSADDNHKKAPVVDDVDGDDVSSADDTPPAPPIRSSSLPFIESNILSPTQSDSKLSKKKERKMERRPSVFASFAKKLTSRKSKEKESNRRSRQYQQQSKSLPTTPTSSPILKPKVPKQTGSSKYKFNIRWSKSQKQSKTSKFPDSAEGLSRPQSFHGHMSRSIHKLSQQNMEVLNKYCSTSFINNSPLRSEDEGAVYKVPLGQSVMGDGTQPNRFVRQSSVQSMTDIVDDSAYSIPRTWKSMELLNDSPMGAQLYSTLKRSDRVDSFDYDNDLDSTISNVSDDDDFTCMNRHVSTTSMHSDSDKSDSNRDVANGYINMYQNVEPKIAQSPKIVYANNIYQRMKFAS